MNSILNLSIVAKNAFGKTGWMWIHVTSAKPLAAPSSPKRRGWGGATCRCTDDNLLKISVPAVLLSRLVTVAHAAFLWVTFQRRQTHSSDTKALTHWPRHAHTHTQTGIDRVIRVSTAPTKKKRPCCRKNDTAGLCRRQNEIQNRIYHGNSISWVLYVLREKSDEGFAILILHPNQKSLSPWSSMHTFDLVVSKHHVYQSCVYDWLLCIVFS